MARRLLLPIAVLTLALLLAACSSSASTTAPSSTSTTAGDIGRSTTTTAAPGPDAVLFATTEGNIDAYLPETPFTRQRVVAAGTGPAGTAPHGQICFLPDGSRRFVVAETRTPAAAPATAGWGVYQLTGDDIGSFRVRRVTGWDSPGAPSTDAPTTYGCAFLPDGRLLTTDVGNEHAGPPTGQLVEWFGPFDAPGGPASCVIAGALSTPLGLAVDNDGAVYLASSRAPTAGVWRYRGTFPSGRAGCVTATPEPPGYEPPTTTTTEGPGGPGGSGSTTTTTPPAPAVVVHQLLTAGTDGLSAPSGVAVAPSGRALVVSSPPDGRIMAYDLLAGSPLALLAPPTGAELGAEPFPGGTPMGVVVGPDGAVLYADPGLVKDATGAIAPGDRTGSIRRISTSGGKPAAPETVNTRLSGPDGLGFYLPTAAASGGASKA